MCECETKRLLQEYSTELGLSCVFSLEEFIASHKAIRENYSALQLLTLKDIRERAQVVARETVDRQYIRLDVLSKMTLQEIIDLIGES